MEKSRYCQECVKFIQKKCIGKDGQGRMCKQYEFDVRLYKFADDSEKPETIKAVRKRQAKRDEEIFNQEAFDDFDLGASLSSADFADII